MKELFHIEKDSGLNKYFTKPLIRKSVDHILNNKKDDMWLDLSLDSLAPSKDINGLLTYKDAWCSAKKIQADYYEFMAKLWDNSWGLVFKHDKFKTLKDQEILEPVNFVGIETCWEKGWQIKYEVTSEKFDQIWLYVEESYCAKKISIGMQFRKDESSNSGEVKKVIEDSEFWKFDKNEGEKKTEGRFILKREINYWDADKKRVKDAMTEMAEFLVDVFQLGT